MNPLKIAFVTSEAAPYAKTGGLADVSGALPRSLAKMGHKVRLFMPGYPQVNQSGFDLRRCPFSVECRIEDNNFRADFDRLNPENGSPEVYFVVNDFFYGRPELYRDPDTGNDYVDNDNRFIFFSKAVLEALKASEWQPDIIHANDWQSALIPAFLNTIYKDDNFYSRTRSLFTIHNMGFQGMFPAPTFEKLGIDRSYFFPMAPFEFYGKVNFMKAAICFADYISTVSPTYAREIQQSDEYGKGLQGVLREHSGKLTGILNGVDYEVWSPVKDRLIPHKYIVSNLSGKKKNKLALLQRCGFPVRTEHPLIGIISRLDRQKGFDLLEEVMDGILAMNVQFVVLGVGDEKYHRFFRSVEVKYPDKFRIFLELNENLAHLIEAGADIFLMPSRYEPCGLNQLYSLKYGTVPVVRKTGGLADTVTDFDPAILQGTGFVFEKYESSQLLNALKRAVEMYRRKRIWYKIIKQGMSLDFSWNEAARKYSELYYSILSGSD
jgi:starch synthase